MKQRLYTTIRTRQKAAFIPTNTNWCFCLSIQVPWTFTRWAL